MYPPSAHGLHHLSSDELRRLLRALHRGVLAPRVSRAQLIEKGFGNIEGHLGALVGREPIVATVAVAAVLQERAAWEQRWEQAVRRAQFSTQ